jgi:hypothetical protein
MIFVRFVSCVMRWQSFVKLMTVRWCHHGRRRRWPRGEHRRRDAQARFEDNEPFLDVSIISHYEKQLHSGI